MWKTGKAEKKAVETLEGGERVEVPRSVERILFVKCQCKV